MKWLLVQADGTVKVEEGNLTLEALQSAVDGYAEAVAAPEPELPVTVFINEERRSFTHQPLMLNGKATTFLRPVLWPGTRIVGPMVIAGLPDENGETTGLDDEQIEALKGRLDG